MEKFNPNKKRWEPLWSDTSVDLTGFLSAPTVKKYAPAPKDLEKPVINTELPEKVDSHISDYVEKMTTFEEKEDAFIFEHLARWFGSVTSLIGVTVIPKRLIIRSVECFKHEHREEYEAIMKGDNK